jgi:AraC-like DNA-binding protein
MLVGGGTLRFGTASYRSHVAFERRFRMYVVERGGLVYDTRMVPANRGQSNGEVLLNVVLEGEIEWHATDGAAAEKVVGPAVLVHLEDHFEGAEGKFPRTLRTSGDRFCNLELRFKREDLKIPIEPVPRRLPDDPALFEAARAYVDATAHNGADRDGLVPRARAVVDAWARLGAVSPELAAGIKTVEDEVLERTWLAIATFYERLHMSPTISELTDLAGVSSRQVSRDLDKLFETFGIRGEGWRATMLQWRLRMAAMLLSAERAQVNEVASFVGYGSTEAMAHAFRDAGLPSPSEVRSALRPGS